MSVIVGGGYERPFIETEVREGDRTIGLDLEKVMDQWHDLSEPGRVDMFYRFYFLIEVRKNCVGGAGGSTIFGEDPKEGHEHSGDHVVDLTEGRVAIDRHLLIAMKGGDCVEAEAIEGLDTIGRFAVVWERNVCWDEIIESIFFCISEESLLVLIRRIESVLLKEDCILDVFSVGVLCAWEGGDDWRVGRHAEGSGKTLGTEEG